MTGQARPPGTCRGVTATGAACQRRATNPSGWCGVCIGLPCGPGAGSSPPAAPPDPLGSRLGWVDQLDPAALQRLAANHDTPDEVLRQLAVGRRSLRYVREVLAARDPVPADVLVTVHDHLTELARYDPDDYPVEVAESLAANSSCPPELFEALTDDDMSDLDGDAVIARAAAANPSCPPGVLARLAEDRWVAEVVAANPACPTGTLHDLAADGDEATAAAVAANPSCPPELLAALADPDFGDGVTSAVASNPACPPGTLERLAGDPRSGPATVAAVAAHPGCPPAARAAAGLLAG